MGVKKVVLVLTFLITNLITAQQASEKYSLTGAVSDLMTNKPLSKVSVIVFSKTSGKELQGGTSDEKGFFSIENIAESKVRLRLSCVGYQTQVLDSISLDKSSRVGLVQLFPTAIEMPELVVKTIKPVIEFYADKQVINMDRLPGNTGSLTEALKNSGLVEVEPSTNKISVRGQPTKIQMDGHEYNMPSEMLSQLPATMIDQVEVVLAPGAKESAEGGIYIINLLTKKNTFSNFNGMVSLTSATNKNTYGGLYFGYKADKLNLFGQAYGSYFDMNNTIESERYVYTSPSMYYQNSLGGGSNTFFSGYFKLGFDYDFDESNTATFFVNYNGYNYNSDNTNYSYVNNKSNIFQYSYNRENNNEGVNKNLSIYGFYKKKFSARGHELIFDLMYTDFGNPTDSKMNLDYSNKIGRPDIQNSNTDVTAKTMILKTDYSLPINLNKLEAGYSLTYRKRNNDYDVENFSYKTNSWLDSLQLSNLFKYNEVINALYVSYAHKIGDFDIKAGLRAENLSTEGNQVTQNTNFEENFLSFFPNLNVSYKLSDLFQLGFNAFRRVTYPQIYYINPFRQYTGPNSFFAGNPRLEPSYVSSFAVNLSQYLSIFYTHTTGSFTSATTIERDSILLSSFINLNTQDSYGFTLTIPYYNTPMMPFHLPDFISTCYISLNYRYSKQTGQYLAEDLSLTDKNLSLNAYIGFKLWYGIDANISFFYRPRTENRRMISGEFKNLSIYLNKSMIENKLRAYLFVNDLFGWQKNENYSMGDYFYTRSYYATTNSRSIGIGVSYMFNDYKDRRDRNIDDGRDAGERGF